MHTHDQGSHPQHVVSVGERDEGNGGKMVDQHNVEILTEVEAKKKRMNEKKIIKSVEWMIVVGKCVLFVNHVFDCFTGYILPQLIESTP